MTKAERKAQAKAAYVAARDPAFTKYEAAREQALETFRAARQGASEVTGSGAGLTHLLDALEARRVADKAAMDEYLAVVDPAWVTYIASISEP